MKIPKILKSRKVIYCILTIIISITAEKIKLSPDTVNMILIIGSVLILGHTATDISFNLKGKK